jgi:Chlorophyllase enzyme
MTALENSKAFLLVLSVATASLACGSSESEGGAAGGASTPAGASGTANGGQTNGAGAGGGPAGTSGATTNGGTLATGGAQNGGTAGVQNGGAAAAQSGGVAGAAPADGNCTVGKWPAADPAAAGPYETVTENEVGPEAGQADEDTGMVPKFTLFRPKDLSPNGLCHPVITWGNGTGSTPNLYRSLLSLFASHGFVVIASNSKNVSRGDPKPMLVGVTWVLEQNEDPSSVLYHRLDASHIGATGHSQGAVATSQASGDARITTNVPIEGAMVQRNLHGPAMFFCGGLDDIVGCDGAQSALDAVTTLPAMYAEYLSVDHGSWMSFNNKPSVVYSAINAWMRVHLMADDSLRTWFYGDGCQLCEDAGWQIQQKNMNP